MGSDMSLVIFPQHLKPLFGATDLSYMVLPQSGSLSDNQSSSCILCLFCFSLQVLYGSSFFQSWVWSPHSLAGHLGSHFSLSELYTPVLIISSSPPLCLHTSLFLETLSFGTWTTWMDRSCWRVIGRKPLFEGDPRCQCRKNFALGQGLDQPGGSCLDTGSRCWRHR